MNITASAPTLWIPNDIGEENFSEMIAKLGNANAPGSESNMQLLQAFCTAVGVDLENLLQEIEGKSPIKVTNASPSFASDNTYQDYGYKGTITVTRATASMRPEVIFGLTEAMSGNYAPICESGAGVVYIYAKVNTPITIPLVIVHKE